MKRAVSVLSAGLDSSLALALALEEGWQVCLALTFDYGQRAAEREVTQAGKIAAYFKVPHKVLRLPWFREFGHGGSLLKRSESLPYPKTEQLSDPKYGKESAKAVWVPNRNGTFLEIAAGFAEDQEAEALIVGFNKEEAATFPDNSESYMKAATKALSYSTANQVKVVSLTVDLDKTAIVKEAKRLAFPLELVWSCYEGGPKMCRNCESCRRFERALKANGVDPNAYF
jgi:7-cyano-7-deazaguanine synthase